MMGARRFAPVLALVAVASLGLAGCEPYLSMTDQVPEHTRRATALLPESPRYVGMVDLETVLTQIDEVTNVNFADSLRQTDNPRLRAFLDATGMDPETDLKAIYGAVGEGTAFSAVLFADLTPAQLDRYLNQASGARGRATSYRDIPVYHLTAGLEGHDEGEAASDTLSLAFVRTGMIAAARSADQLRAMIDRHRASADGFRDNESYMTLVQRVGHGSTAWLVGRDVLQSALQDSTSEVSSSGPRAAGLNGAGIQRVLSQWSDRVLGLSEASGSLEETAGDKFGRLRRQVREQALSLTLNDDALDAEVYLTMRDETSATNVVDIARGALAAVRLSGDGQDEGLLEILKGVDVERNGPIVHVQFSISRDRLSTSIGTATLRPPARRDESSIRRSNRAVRRLGGIKRVHPAFNLVSASTKRCNPLADRSVHCVGSTTDSPVQRRSSPM